MKITSGKIYALRIPFVEAFAHSAMNRKFSDSFVVQIIAEDGTKGFGEGAARPFVTGETVETSVEYIKKQLYPAVAANDFNEIRTRENASESFAGISGTLPDAKSSNNVIFHAAQSAVELALIDCLLKTQNIPLGKILSPKRDAITYSGVITAGTIENAVRHAKRFKLFGIRQIKIKIGFADDAERVAKVRETVGEDVSIRVDANGAFDVKTAVELAEKLAKYNVDAIEQPVARGDVKELAEVKKRSPIPVMADESLVTREDAEKLIEYEACDFFNLRISKCGGIANTLEIANLAKQAGIRLQFGCQVGETAILSAAGRHAAAFLEDVEFVEGSYGNLLLSEDISQSNINFGFGGRAPVLRASGLGVTVSERILEKYAHRTINLGKELVGYA